MRYLVDTDYVASYLKGRSEAEAVLRELAQQGLAISLITYGEIFEGIYYGRNPSAQEQGFLRFLRGVNVLPLNRPIMRRFARMRGELRRLGQLIGDPDLLIAATCLHDGLTLVTYNIGDFSRIPNLVIYSPV